MIHPDETTRIGIYGGTFNPIHEGHLKAAREVALRLSLERVIFIPSAEPPHKTPHDHDPLAPARDRMAWVELAIADQPEFEASSIELAREGASYTIDTLETLVDELAPARLVFIIGHDAFVELATWRAPEEILALVDIAVVVRPPVAPGRLDQWLPDFARELVDVAEDGLSARHRTSDTRIDVLEVGALDISASQIREDLAGNRPVEGRLPAPVLAQVAESGYYSHVEQAGETTQTRESGASGEISDETQRKKLALIIDAALERNAQKPVALDVRSLTSYTDCVVVVSGNSQRQLRAISQGVVKALKAVGDAPLGVEGGGDATWMLIDANDVIVHVFQPETREMFDIEGLWVDAPRVALDLPDHERIEPR